MKDEMMRPQDLRLFDLLRINEAQGAIFLGDQRMIVVNSDDLGLLRKELINTLGTARARGVLIRFGYARGYRDALLMHQMFGWKTVDDWVNAGARLYTLEGSGLAEVVGLRVDREKHFFEAESTLHNSFEAQQHAERFGKGEASVCWVLTGYASGYCSAVIGDRIFFREDSCRGKGDLQCHMIGQSMDIMTDEVRQAVKEFHGEDFEREMRTVVTALDNRTRELEREREHAESLQRQVIQLEKVLTLENNSAAAMVVVSDALRKVMDQVARVAATDAMVLVLGETGTGKDLIARELHRLSPRQSRPFVTLNCGALAPGLAESEVFGHEKGAFTGALQRKLGRFELADKGTLFLDEIGELPLDTQVKFLNLLQRGEFERLGGSQTHKADVRVIAATNRDLEELVEQGKFRADLFYRLNIFPIHVPPLRDRVEDIIPLVSHFVQKFRVRFGKNIKAVSRESLSHLEKYSWPGNVRELEHVIERAVLLTDGEILTVDLDVTRNHHVAAQAIAPLPQALVALDDLERAYLERVLENTGGVIEGKGGAAEILKLNASTLRSRLKKLDISFGSRAGAKKPRQPGNQPG